MLDPPDGFAPLFRTSPFLDVLGPFYHRREGRALILGVRIAEKHCNARGTAHGGLLMTRPTSRSATASPMRRIRRPR